MSILIEILVILILICALMVIISKNPVHSIFYLILVFCGSATLLISLGAEFLGLILIIVYVGAVAVLFLFVVMMLNIKVIEINANFINYLPLSSLLFLFVFTELFSYMDFVFPIIDITGYINWAKELNREQNIVLLGLVLYTHFFHFFLLTSLILLVAMIGSIVLTLNHTKYVRRQKIYEQQIRNWHKSVRSHSLKNKNINI